MPVHFYPRSPCGERHTGIAAAVHCCISIHALLAESDSSENSASPIRPRFLSTLSLRRATPGRAPLSRVIGISIHALLAESDPLIFNVQPRKKISIHALLAESDKIDPDQVPGYTISIHALLAESDHPKTSDHPHNTISIHALLAESDHGFLYGLPKEHLFLSTLSLRRAT